ncbi:AarF/ABC1/UbiB kinase family protein [Erythrobacteraceae bacterium CFH 75059]|nr:AarF/ABC1/UbiB kinase family protein [Erythrobacteraceae bacterium CFH 75059]
MDDADPGAGARRWQQRAVPAGRMSRLAGFGRLAGGIAGNVLTEGAARWTRGERPRLNDLLLTPRNAARLTDELAQMRGAAMKMGQMLSLDAGDLLPPELSGILATLRDRGSTMPTTQLDATLRAEWGTDWRQRFRRFDPRPVAAASIGQVHRAETRDGRQLAVKVQYPGVAQSIDSDVDNITSLLRLSGMLPPSLDLGPVLTAAKRQLHEEADYEREGAMLAAFADQLRGDARFIVPELDRTLTTARILVMSFEEGSPIESLASEAQALRNCVFAHLVELVARELFQFGMMQTDPNFANYLYQRASGRIVLLDFGATQTVPEHVSGTYRRLITAGLAQNYARVRDEAVAAGFLGAQAVVRHPDAVAKAIAIIVDEMNRPGPLDFGDRSFVPQIREEAMPIARDRESWSIPPAELLLVQRKVSGTALLGARLGAAVDVRAILQEVMGPPPTVQPPRSS